MLFGKLLQQIGHRMPPCFCAHPLEDSLDGFLGCLLSRETSPIIKTTLHIVSSMFQIALGFIQPIFTPFHFGFSRWRGLFG
jgi:hypothetical protein